MTLTVYMYQHQGCIICKQQYLHSSIIHPINVSRGIIIVILQIYFTLSDGTLSCIHIFY